MLNFTTLSEMLDSDEFQVFLESKLGNDLFISNPERASRCHEAAEYGTDGSTHGEIIDDFYDFIYSLKIFNSDYMDKEEISDCDLSDETYNSIIKEIEEVYNWHYEHNTLDKQAG